METAKNLNRALAAPKTPTVAIDSIDSELNLLGVFLSLPLWLRIAYISGWAVAHTVSHRYSPYPRTIPRYGRPMAHRHRLRRQKFQRRRRSHQEITRYHICRSYLAET
jgi:hypothetical protein